MMETTQGEILEFAQRIKVKCRYYAGKIGTRFFQELRDNKKILGIKTAAGKVYWPPRETCQDTWTHMTEDNMVEVGPEGEVVTFTQVHYNEPHIPREAPFIYAVIKLDGADTGITHFLDEVDYEKVKTGMRVKPVFENKRQGTILDIKHFKPV